MKPEVKRRVRRYGIPIDLVILATGVALLFSTITGPAVVLIYLLAVVASTFRLGWRSGLTAIAAAIVMMLFGFGEAVRYTHELALAGFGLVAIGVDEWRRRGFINPGAVPEIRQYADDFRARAGPAVRDMTSRAATTLRGARSAADARWTSLRAGVARRLEQRRERAARIEEEASRVIRYTPPSPRIEPPPPPQFQVTAQPEEPEPAPREQIAAPPPPSVDIAAIDEERERLRQEKEELERRLADHRQEVAAEMQAERDALDRRLEENRQMLERAESERAERERLDAERTATVRAAAQRLAAERQERQRIEKEREELARKLEEERQAAERAVAERSEHAKREAEKTLEERLAAERATLQKKYDEQLRAELEKAAKAAAAPAPERKSIFGTMLSWLKTPQHSRPAVNLTTRKVAGNTTATKRSTPSPGPASASSTGRGSGAALRAQPSAPRPVRPSSQRERRPRILMLERRRQMADTMAPKLKAQGVDVEIVERWIDAVDELFRFRPDAIFVDAEVPDFPRVHQSILEQSPRLPLFVTTGSYGALPNLPRAAAVMRPYAADAIAKLARDAMTNPQPFLERQKVHKGPTLSPAAVSEPSMTPLAPRPTTPTPPPRPSPTSTPLGNAPARSTPAQTPMSGPRPAPSLPSGPRPVPAPPPAAPVLRPVPAPVAEPVALKPAAERYPVVCFNCQVAFDASEADWCSCLTKERTLICTNCLTCFCNAPPAYKEKFWADAPAGMLERKTAELRKQMTGLQPNPVPEKVRRPLVMLVEDDADIQFIVQRVCTNLGYGFVYATNGQEGLNLAREYKPNLILTDAFMPKMDGREMCRILKEEGSLPHCKMIVMTGLYTDTKYKNEALVRFHIDDYLTKPVLITDLINLLQKNLEGLTGIPPQENLHERHRKGVQDAERAAAAEAGENAEPPIDAASSEAEATTYEVCCFTCGKMFDAMQAKWCNDTGRDQTLLCPHCDTCFCKAPAAYKEKFWQDAPPALFERKTIHLKRNGTQTNPSPMEVTRPLILLVEDDEDIHLIVKTVVTTMGYGFIAAANGQEGLAMAREYNPDLILSDAFMPKLDGREMCRQLKEDPATARIKAIIMTGLYTDRKYRTEALSRFKVDDYVAKPVAVDDLIKLMKKYLPQDVQQTM